MGILQGKRAIVVGASSGIGYGTALRFAQEGADIVTAARRLEKLEALKEDAKDRGFSGKMIPVECDILNEADLDKVVKTCVNNFGGVDILACIAQAGMSDQQYTLETTPDNARLFFDGGPIYTMLMIQKCMPFFQKQNYGRIITCASAAGMTGNPGFTGYSIAKAGIVALTRLCAREFGPFGVVTNCFLPLAKADSADYSEQGREGMEMVAKMVPVGYLGEPYKDCSPIIAFMASEGAHYMNGQFIAIDGGAINIV